MDSLIRNQSHWSPPVSQYGETKENDPFLEKLSSERPESSGSHGSSSSRSHHSSDGILGVPLSSSNFRTSRWPGLLSIATLMYLLRSLRPSFLTSSGSNSRPTKILPTTYLNGVRGFAACCVYMQHYLVKYFKWLDKGYMSTPQENHILQIPFIRLIFTGRFMVANFFILSGFVLAIKPLRLVRKRDAALLDCLAGSTFRRAPRLFLPLIPPMFVSAIMNYMFWYCAGPEMPPINKDYKYPSLSGRFYEEYGYYVQLLNPFTWGTYQPRNTPHMWTLPMEFRGSMVVFLGILMLAKAKTAVRLLVFAAFAYYCLATGHWDTFLFICGILLAELHLLKRESGAEDLLLYLSNKNGAIKRIAPIFWSITFATALFLGSWPCEKAGTTPGLMTLQSLTPAHYKGEERVGYFWYSIAAVMMMMALENFTVLQIPFNTALGRYMGDISYAFYIIHWTFLWTIGRVITNATISMFGMYLGWFVGALICLPMSIVVADVYWRAFDNGAVNFSRWLWIKCSVAAET